MDLPGGASYTQSRHHKREAIVFVPLNPKIYHIVHVDRLESIVSDGFLWSDAEARRRGVGGTTIGMHSIKERRLDWRLDIHNGLKVGDCVPFNFCPRSVMLYVISRRKHTELAYQGGQERIIHLESDLRRSVAWAEDNGHRWAFTTANAASAAAESYSDIRQLDKIDWDAVSARRWSGQGIDPLVKGHKQAEFLVEYKFPWRLVSRVAVRTKKLYDEVQRALEGQRHRPTVEVKRGWYYWCPRRTA